LGERNGEKRNKKMEGRERGGESRKGRGEEEKVASRFGTK